MSDDLDPHLRALYARIPKDEPSPALDALILRAAAQPFSAPRGRDWLMSFGAVASVVLVSTWVVYLQVREPDTLQKAVIAPAPATPLPVDRQPPAETGGADAMMAEQAQAARRSEELSQLRAEMAARGAAPAAAETVAPADLPTVRLKPETPVTTASRQAVAKSEPAMDMAEPAAAAPPLPQALMKPRAAALERAGIASVLIEGVSLGMGREDLAALGWPCTTPVCVRPIDDPRQPAYWGMPTPGATQRVLLLGGTVTAMSLSQVNVALNNVKLALERIGKPSERTCPLGGGEQLVGRQVGNMILSLWQDGEVTILGACLAKD